MAPKYKFTYFDIRGRGEPIRMAFHYAGVEFEDERIKFEDFPALKPNLPLGFLPVLKTPSGTEISQTIAILWYLSDEFNLHGADNDERGLINTCLLSCKEIHDECTRIFWVLKEEADKEAAKKALATKVQLFYTYFDKLLSANSSSKWLVGDKPSIADIYIIDVIEAVTGTITDEDLVGKFPSLKKLDENVRSLDNIKKYLETRK